MTNSCCGLAVIFCGFILLLIGHETINIPEIFSGVHGFTGTTVKESLNQIFSFQRDGAGVKTKKFFVGGV